MDASNQMRRPDKYAIFFVAIMLLMVIGHAVGLTGLELAIRSLVLVAAAYLWVRVSRPRELDVDVEPGAYVEDETDEARLLDNTTAEPPGAPSPAVPPSPYPQRLAHFLHCQEDDLKKKRPRPKSTMPFWSIRPLGTRHGPKPLWHIRMLLVRIHRLVRGGRNGHSGRTTSSH